MFRTTFVCTHKGNVPTSTAASKLLEYESRGVFLSNRQPRAYGDFGTCTLKFQPEPHIYSKPFTPSLFLRIIPIFSVETECLSYSARGLVGGTYTRLNMTDYDTLNYSGELSGARLLRHSARARFRRTHYAF